MIKILLLSAGTNACYCLAKKLKEKFNNIFYIVGADINDQYLIPTCHYIDKFYKVPYSSDKNYYKEIIDICQKEKIDYLLPSFDEDQKLFYPENKDLIDLGVRSLGVCEETLKIYKDKISMNNFLKKNGFKIPELIDRKEIKDNTEYFIKPINGVGSQGVQIIDGLHLKKIKYDNIIIQEKCSDPEITLECFNYKGKLRTVARERIASKSGVCTKTRIFNSKELQKISENFIKKINTPYCFNLQFMKNSKNEYVITDVNLRLAGGMSLSSAAGWDEVSALAKIMLNKKESEIFSTLPVNIIPQFIVRAYTDIVTKIDKPTVAFDLDGTLLDSRKRHIVVMNETLEKYGIKLNTEDLINYKRNNKNNIEYLISKGIDKNVAQEIQKEWIKHIEDEKYLKLDVLYNDAIPLINKYADNDLILITARARENNARKQIESLGLKDKFKKIFVVATNNDVSKIKSEILKNENAILMIGDTLSDLNAANIAKIEFVFHKNGFHNEEVLNSNG